MEKERIKPFVYVVAVVAALSGLLFGCDIGGSGGTFTMSAMREYFSWPEHPSMDKEWVVDQQSWITSVFAVGAIAGGLASEPVASRLGRRWALQLLALIFSFGALLQMFCWNVESLYVGRVIAGLGVGALSMVAPMYLAEIAPVSIRGRLVTIQQLCITFGIVLAAAANVGLQHWRYGWRVSYGGNVVFSILLLLLMLPMPESPAWLVAKGRTQDARKALMKVRYEESIDAELDYMQRAHEESMREETARWSELWEERNQHSYRTWTGIAFQIFQQCTGINAIMYYAPLIFASFLSARNAIFANLAIMVVNFLATFVALALVDRVGRRPLLITGSICMTVALGTVAGVSDLTEITRNKAAAGIVTAAFCVHVASFAYSWGPLGWLVPSEIFPQRLRDKALMLTTTANWATNFVLGKLTPFFLLPSWFNLSGTALFYMTLCITMGLFVMFLVPETKGIPIEGMTPVFQTFREKRFRARI